MLLNLHLMGKYTQTSTFLLSQPLHHYLKEAQKETDQQRKSEVSLKI